jgi:hypothetical protein
VELLDLVVARDTEVGIELVGNAERVCLERETQQIRVAVEGTNRIHDAKKLQLVQAQGDPPEVLRPAAD